MIEMECDPGHCRIAQFWHGRGRRPDRGSAKKRATGMRPAPRTRTRTATSR